MTHRPRYLIAVLSVATIVAVAGVIKFFPGAKLKDDFAADPGERGWTTTGEGAVWQHESGLIASGEDQWDSPGFPVTPYEWLRVELMTTATDRALWAVIFENENGEEMDSDHYSSVDASTELQNHVFHVRVKAGATRARLRLRAPDPVDEDSRLSVRKVVVMDATRKQVRAWADELYDTMPDYQFKEATSLQSSLPRSFAALKGGQNLRVVMLGDSIMNDIGNSPLDILIEPHYPGSRVEIVTSVRSGTGMNWYQHEGRVVPYVVDYEPDLVMLGGISNSVDVEPFRNVIRQIGEQSDAEILLLTGPVGSRSPEQKGHRPEEMDGLESTYPQRLQSLAMETGVAFYDLEKAWDAYVVAAGQPYDWYLRDRLHANMRGRQVLARTMAAAFRPSDGGSSEIQNTTTDYTDEH